MYGVNTLVMMPTILLHKMLVEVLGSLEASQGGKGRVTRRPAQKPGKSHIGFIGTGTY
jgi:hypothetical protein